MAKSLPRILFSYGFILVLAAAACNLPGSPSPTPSTEASEPPPGGLTEPPLSEAPPVTSVETLTQPPLTEEITATTAPIGVFEIAVIVDLDSEPVSRTEAEELVEQASAILMELTGFAYRLVDFLEAHRTGTVDDLARDYIAGHPVDELPNGILIFSFGDDDRARTYGGYAYTLPAPAGFRNQFNSPVAGDDKIYIAVGHWGHRFARCGYGSSTAEEPVQDTSFNGECFNQDGIACVEKFGYQMCSTAVDRLYASSRTYFAAATILHETMHSFGPEGNLDHYGTDVCNQKMEQGISERTYTLDFIHESEYYNVMCPYVYDNFVNSYQP